MTIRKAFRMSVHAGQEAEYERRHTPIGRELEDVLLSRRLTTLGRVVVLPKRILVAPRRWQRVGLVRQTLRNWTLMGLYAAGCSPQRLARLY